MKMEWIRLSEASHHCWVRRYEAALVRVRPYKWNASVSWHSGDDSFEHREVARAVRYWKARRQAEAYLLALVVGEL